MTSAGAQGTTQGDGPGGPSRDPLVGRGFAVMLLTAIAAFTGLHSLLSVVPLWAAAGGSNQQGAGLTTGVFMLTTVSTQPLVPWLISRAGYRAAFSIGLVLLGAPAPLYAVSAHIGPVLGVSAVRGIGFGIVTVTGAALVAELAPPARRGEGQGLYGLAIAVPNLLALPLGVWIAQNVGFSPAFWLGAAPLVGLVGTAAMGDVQRAGGGGRDRQSRTQPGTERRVPWKHRRAAGVLVLVPAALPLACGTVASGGLVTFLPFAFGGTPGVASAALFVIAGTSAASRWLSGRVSDRLGPGRLLAPGVILTVLGLLGPAAGAYVGDLTGTVALLAGLVVFGTGLGVIRGETLVLAFARSSPERYGTASAVWNVAFDAGTGVGAFALGAAVVGYGYAAAFLIAAGGVLVGLPVALRIRRAPAATPP
ncbi:MAG: MFS transporter [Streptosporangiaceae bacterium]